MATMEVKLRTVKNKDNNEYFVMDKFENSLDMGSGKIRVTANGPQQEIGKLNFFIKKLSPF